MFTFFEKLSDRTWKSLESGSMADVLPRSYIAKVNSKMYQESVNVKVKCTTTKQQFSMMTKE